MKKFKYIRYTIFLVIFFAFVTNLYSAKIVYVFGDVKIKKSNSENWINARKGMKLFANDTIQTLNKSRATLNVINGYSVKLSANTVMAIRDLGHLKDKGIFPSIMLFIGEVYSDIKNKMISKVEVHTQTAVIGVRGTQFITGVSSYGLTSLQMQEGFVDLNSIYDTNKIEKVSGNELSVIDDSLKIKKYVNKTEWDSFLVEKQKDFEKTPEKIQAFASNIFDILIKNIQVLNVEYQKNKKIVFDLKKNMQSMMQKGNREQVIKINDEIYAKSFDLHNIFRKIKHEKLRALSVEFLLNDNISKKNKDKIQRIKELSVL